MSTQYNLRVIGPGLSNWRDIEGWAWCSEEVREWHFITRLVNVIEELVGRELNYILESRGLRNDETAVHQIVIVGLTQETHFEEGSGE